jgi:hypothetical protein
MSPLQFSLGHQLSENEVTAFGARRKTRLVTLLNETERVTCRVQEYPEMLPGLVISFSSTDAEDVTFSLVEIVDLKVEMHLFRHGSFGPGGCHIVLDSLETQNRKVIMCQVEIWRVRGETRSSLYGNASQVRIKRCEFEGFGTVKQHKAQPREFHIPTLGRTWISTNLEVCIRSMPKEGHQETQIHIRLSGLLDVSHLTPSDAFLTNWACD